MPFKLAKLAIGIQGGRSELLVEFYPLEKPIY